MNCDLCKQQTNTLVYNMAPKEALCEKCLSIISSVLSIEQWTAALAADRRRNAEQIELLIEFAKEKIVEDISFPKFTLAKYATNS